MSSWMVRMFMSKKIEVAIDESCRKERRALDLSHMNLKRVPTAAIARLYHSKIRLLLLQKNYLNELPENFGLTMKKLELLTLDYNELTELPSSFCLMQNLTFLNISNNQFEIFPLSLVTLRNLRTLWANGIGIKEIPEDIGRMSNLRFLGLRNNSLVEISQGICLLTRLKWLTFANNDIEIIPFELCNLKSLIHLNLNFNKIVTLPNIWSELLELSYLFLQSNLIQMDRSVVRQIRELPKLKRAHLAGNRIRTTNELYEYVIVPKAIPENARTGPTAAEARDVPGNTGNPPVGSSRMVEGETTEDTAAETIRTTSASTNAFETNTSSSNVRNQSNLNPELQHDTRINNGTIGGNPEDPQNPQNPIIGNQGFQNDADELLDFQESWEYSESTNSLDDHISGSDESDFEELPMDSTHAAFGLWGILTS